jgi:hypothetical protein
MNHVSVYHWRPKQKSQRYKLLPYYGSTDIFACDEFIIKFPENMIYYRNNGNLYTASLRDPKKDIKNLKHQAHFDTEYIGDWAEAF